MRFDFSPLFRSTVGFDRLFDTLDQVSQYDAAQSYPPYNIERTSENAYRVTVAVAGFAEKDLTVEVRDGQDAVAHFDGQILLGKASDGNGHAVGILAGA